MTNDKQSKTTIDFIDKINQLLENKEARNKREIVDKLEWNETALSNVMNGRRDVPEQIATKLFKLYNNEKDDAKELRDAIEKLSPLIRRHIQLLEERIQARDKRIESMQKTEGLQDRLIASLEGQLSMRQQHSAKGRQS